MNIQTHRLRKIFKFKNKNSTNLLLNKRFVLFLRYWIIKIFYGKHDNKYDLHIVCKFIFANCKPANEFGLHYNIRQNDYYWDFNVYKYNIE